MPHDRPTLVASSHKVKNILTDLDQRIDALEVSATVGDVLALDYIPQQFHDAILDRTSSEDLTIYLQEWLDFCMFNNKKGHLPSGLYNIFSPLYVTRVKQPSGFYTNHIEGDGGGYTQTISQSTIVCNHLDGPGIIIDRGRGVVISHIQITGKNVQNPSLPTDTPADYQSPGVRTSSYSPHCCIAIDGTLGDIPPDGGYPGLTYLGGALPGGSKNIRIENVSIASFLIGIMVSPAQSFQAEQLIFSRCTIQNCEFAYSVGQSQARACIFTNGDISRCRVSFTGIDHGSGQGVAPRIENNQFVFIFRVFQFADGFGNLSMTGCFCERVLMLGSYGSSDLGFKYSLGISDCVFKFEPVGGLAGNAFPPIILESGPPALISGCHFLDVTSTTVVMNFIGGGRIAFIGCIFSGKWRDDLPIKGSVANQETSTPSIFQSCRVGRTDGFSTELNNVSSAGQLLPLSFSVAPTFPPGQIIFDAPEASSLSVGQLIYWRLNEIVLFSTISICTALEITDITADTVTCKRLFPDEYYFESGTWGAPNAIVAPTAPA